MEDNQKAALLAAAAGLLQQSEYPESVTSRQIAAQAGVNAAMINYYYGSKEALVAQAVGTILEEAAGLFQMPPDPSDPPKERLRKTLCRISRTVLRYRRFTKVYVPYLLLEEDIRLPLLLLPDIREYFAGGRDETECRMVAFEIVSFLQLAFYRSDALLTYAGLNLSEEPVCDRMVDWELDLLLG